jgi:HPt (histidine-containing phosphotransfer) domain-containing protein
MQAVFRFLPHALSAVLRPSRVEGRMVADTTSNEALLFDQDHLARYIGSDEDLRTELLGLMKEQAKRCLDLMANANDRSSWRIAAHTLKGAARGVGAFALADACEAAEEMPEESWPCATLMVGQKITETEMAIAQAA